MGLSVENREVASVGSRGRGGQFLILVILRLRAVRSKKKRKNPGKGNEGKRIEGKNPPTPAILV